MKPLYIAALVLIVAAYLTGRHQEHVSFQARLDAAQVQADAAAAETTKALMAAEQARRQEAQAFEDKLNAIPDTGAVCVPSEWVR